MVAVRILVIASAIALTNSLSASQAIGVLQIKVVLVDSGRGAMPVARHVLLISDNPATAEPRRVLTAADGTVVVKLRPGNYTVESDRPVALQGKAYRWTQIIDVVDGRTTTLELTTANADVETVTTETPGVAAPAESDPSFLLTQWQDSVVGLWTPTTRASGALIDARGLIVTSQRAIGAATRVDVQITPAIKVAARVLASDEVRDVAVLWIASAEVASARPLPLDCGEAAKSTIVNGQEVLSIGAPLRGDKVMESGRVNRVTTRTMAADFDFAFGGAGGPVFTTGGRVIGIASLPNERDDSAQPDSRIVRLDPVCEAVAAAAKQMTAGSSPSAAHLPVDPLEPLSQDRLRSAAERRAGSVAPYLLSGFDFDVAFITPLLIYAAQNSSANAAAGGQGSGSRGLNVESFIRPLVDFANWSEYVSGFPPVLLIRVTPKLVEGFWTKVGRAAAMTQGMALPPIKRFTSGFSRMRAFCGDAEVTPIHRLSESDAITEGLYAFDPAALGPACKSVRLELYSEKAPEKADTRMVDAKLLEQIWQDFTAVH
jgi:S1-C subfamily serine protease